MHLRMKMRQYPAVVLFVVVLFCGYAWLSFMLHDSNARTVRNYDSIHAMLLLTNIYGSVYKEKRFHKPESLPTGNLSHYGNMPSWLPECEDIYLDLGSNIGVMVRKLFEPERYPESKIIDVYNRIFHHLTRTGSKSGLCALGFEPNPKHQKRLQEIQRNYSSKGWKVHFFPFAISDKDEMVTFFTEDNSTDMDFGATVFRRKHITYTPYTVKGIRLATFMKTVFHGKQIKLAKLDIEGSEFKVLVDMLEYGLLCQNYIKAIYADFHNGFVRSLEVTENPAKDLIKEINAQACHMTEVLEIDDETYLHDIDAGHVTRHDCVLVLLCLAKTLLEVFLLP